MRYNAGVKDRGATGGLFYIQNKTGKKGAGAMARAPNEKTEQAKELFLNGVKLIEIASQLDIPPGTVRRWKSVYNWDKEKANRKANEPPKKRGAPLGNKNGQGNKGSDALKGNKRAVGHKSSTPKGNKNAQTHGLFAKWLPDETREIMGIAGEISPLELIWCNIQMQYAAIIRAQKIMFVKDQDDITRELSSRGAIDTYDIQFAWDKHATFMAAQSRAMKTLQSLINQYDRLSSGPMATEEQRARIDKLKSEIARMNGETDSMESDGFIEALKSDIAETWGDDGDGDI